MYDLSLALAISEGKIFTSDGDCNRKDGFRTDVVLSGVTRLPVSVELVNEGDRGGEDRGEEVFCIVSAIRPVRVNCGDHWSIGDDQSLSDG